MNTKQKNQFKTEISSIISKRNLMIEDIKKVTKSERQDFVNNELLTINKLALQWALKNKIISPDELKSNEFFTKNALLSDFISEAGIGAIGIGGAAYALNMAIAPVFLGLGGGFAAVGVAGAAVIATPVVLAGLGIIGAIKWKENKEIERLTEYFIVEQAEILNFYYAKINKLKSTPITISKVKTVENIEKKVIQKDTVKKTDPSKSELLKKETRPKIKQIEKDVDYDKCVVRYDDKLKACSIKYEDSLRGKKDGLHGKTFESFAYKIPKIIGHDIFNQSGEIIFIGTKSNFATLENKCKLFKDTDDIEITIVFRDIAKKSLNE